MRSAREFAEETGGMRYDAPTHGALMDRVRSLDARPDLPEGTRKTMEVVLGYDERCGRERQRVGAFLDAANEVGEARGEPTPAEADPAGDWYCFERGARKDTGGDGWADVWKRGCFAWEYKGRRADLDAAFDQLRQYALALENPPLLIVSDMVRFRIRTNWTNSVSVTHEFTLDDLADGATRDKLKWAMSEPERLRPGETRQAVTERAAATFAELGRAGRPRVAVRRLLPMGAAAAPVGRPTRCGHGPPLPFHAKANDSDAMLHLTVGIIDEPLQPNRTARIVWALTTKKEIYRASAA